MKKIKSFFSKLRNRNFIFISSLILCVGVISFVAFSMNESQSNAIKIENITQTSTVTTTLYKSGADFYKRNSLNRVNSDTTTSASATEKTSDKVSDKSTVKATVKKSVKDSEKESVKSSSKATSLKNEKKTKEPSTTTSAKKNKKKVKRTVQTTAVKKIKKTVSTTVASTTAKTTKKKKIKTTTVQTTTTAVTKAYTPKKAKSNTYKTRDISKEKYTVKSATTGKKIKSNGFDILCQIVNGEINPSWNAEAIKAQTVAAYTYLRYCKANSITPVLGVKSGYDSRIEKIVKSVEGLVCTYNGNVINAVFCASTAGCSADVSNVWGGYMPYLKSVDSKYDAAYDPNYGVTKTVSKNEVKKILQKQGVDLSTKKKNWIKIISNYNGKYVGSVSIDGKLTLTGDKIRSLFGLKSAAFTVKYSNGYFTFTTYGYGHGVGMSQWGAQLYASKGGYKFDQILKHYYRGIKISLSQAV